MKSDIAPRGFGSDVGRFDRWATTYDRSILQRLFFVPIHGRMLDSLAKELDGAAAPKRILDVGCGTGRLLRAAGRRWPQAVLLGADPAERMVAEARRLSAAVQVELSGAELLPFPDSSVDLVTSSLSFHHWGDQARGLGEIARVLRPGGLVCLADHTFLPAKITGERPRSRRQLRVLMEQVGLKVRRQQLAGAPFLLVTIAEKCAGSDAGRDPRRAGLS